MRYERYKQTGMDWLGEVPEHWYRSKLKHEINLVTDKARQDEEIRKYVGLENVKPFTGRFKFENDEEPKIEGEALLFEKNDVLFGKLRPYLAKCVIADFSGRCTSELLVMRPKTIFNRYLFYLMLSDGFLKAIDSSTYGAKMPRASWDFIGNQLLYLPPVTEQYAIAKYLDCRVKKIDSIINAKQKQIDLLQQQRQVVISEAVTKGLDKNVPMKDSGIEFIGEIPENWDICGFTKFISSIIDYRGRTPVKVAEGVFLVTARNIKNGKVDYESSKEYIRLEDYDLIMSRGLPEIGDVLFTTEAPLGEVANVDKTDIALAQRIIKFKGVQQRLDNYYLKYWIMSNGFQALLQTLATGSTAIGIKASKLSQLTIVLPPFEEQVNIVKYLDSFTNNIYQLMNIIQTQITKLKEYRQSLIYEAVTGKIKVS